MGVIAAILPTAEHLHRLRTALRNRQQVVACADWAELSSVCERQPVHVAVIDLFADGRANFERVRYLKKRLPRLTLIAYVEYSAERAHDLFDAGRQGMDGLVLAGQDDTPETLLTLVKHAESRSLGAIAREALRGVDSVTRDAVLLSITRAHEGLAPEDLARLLALPRRTVSQRLASSGFPAPRRLLTWGRLIFAAHLLEDRHRSADHVAHALAFPSGSAFRNTCQRYLRLTPQEIRDQGGSAHVLRALLREAGARGSTGGDGEHALEGEMPASGGPADAHGIERGA
jgi:AraC-like DNA-binding protein